MNKQGKDDLRGVLSLLSSAIKIVQHICDKEEDCVDNYPENLQGTERYEQMEDAVENLSEALEKLAEAQERIQAVLS